MNMYKTIYVAYVVYADILDRKWYVSSPLPFNILIKWLSIWESRRFSRQVSRSGPHNTYTWVIWSDSFENVNSQVYGRPTE